MPWLRGPFWIRKKCDLRLQPAGPANLDDTTGQNVLERYTYDHFGKRTILEPNGTTVRATSSYNMPFGFTSREHDAETGLMYFRARYYDPHTAEFTSPDPLEYVDGMSLFRGYFGHSGVDSEGKWVWIAVPVVVGVTLIPGCGSPCVPRTAGQCCNAAITNGLAGTDIGGVVCCDGNKVSCVWVSGGATGGTDPTAIQILDTCTRRHEDVHHEHGTCSQKCPSLARLTADLVPIDNAECSAYLAELLCLRRGKASCGGNAVCISQVDAEISLVKSRAVIHCSLAGHIFTIN